MLVLAWDLEIGEDESYDKDVVHRERQLDEITGQKLQGLFFSTEGSKGQCEEHRQGKPGGRPSQRLPEFDHMGFAMKQAEVEGQKDQYAADETTPVPVRDVHQAKHRVNPGTRIAKAADPSGVADREWGRYGERSSRSRTTDSFPAGFGNRRRNPLLIRS